MTQQQMGGRPPKRRSDVCLPLLILLLIFIWPVGLVYLVYKLMLDQGEDNAVNEFVWWVESLFGGGKARKRQGGQGAQRRPVQGVPPQQQAPYRQAQPQGTPQQQAPYQQAQPQAAPQQAPGQQPRPQAAPQQAPGQQARPQAAPQQAPYQQARPQTAPQQARQPQARRTSAAAPSGERGEQKPKAGTVKNRRRSIVLRVIGVILLLIGVPQLVEELGWLLGGSVIWDFFLNALGVTAAGALLFFAGQRQAILARRAAKYQRAMGNADAMELDELAKRVGRSREKVIRELEKLINKEYLNDVYLDLELGYFLRYGAKIRQPKKNEETPREEKAPAQEDARYRKIIQDIRTANDRIDDEELSAKIDRLEQITAQILKEVSAHPEKVEQMHTFFDYYLPTTQKLLDTYADFEETGVEGENLREAKQRIESTMDGIVDGFVRQLDNLYKSDVMDVESDIRVMESMLRRDSASAARDFGGQQVQEKP